MKDKNAIKCSRCDISDIGCTNIESPPYFAIAARIEDIKEFTVSDDDY